MRSTKALTGDTKRALSFVDSGDSSLKRVKRTKTTKACFACRQQKTRCESGAPTADGLSQCARCESFNIECSFRWSPPPTVSDATRSAAASWDDAGGHLQHYPDSRSTPWPYDHSGNRHSFVGSTSYTDHAATRLPILKEWQAREKPYPITPTSPRLAPGVRNLRTPFELATTANTSWIHNANANAEQWAAPISFASEVMEGSMPKEKSKQASCVADDLVAQGIVSPNAAEELSRIWITRYGPWHPMEMNEDYWTASQEAAPSPCRQSSEFQTQKHEPAATSGFLQAAKWSLAARHLPIVSEDCSPEIVAASNKELRRRLSCVLEHQLSLVMLGVDRSLPALRGLLVLSAWASTLASPLDAEGNELDAETRVYDGELLLCAAVHLASQMHLEIDVETAFAQKSADGKRGELTPVISQGTLNRARVMFAVSVANVLLNLGKGRLCSTCVPLHYAEQIFGPPSVLVIRQGSLGDAHLVFQCRLLVVVLHMANQCDGVDLLRSIGPDEWIKRVTSDFQELDYLQQSLVTTFALVSQDHIVTTTSIVMLGHFLKLTSIFRAFRTVYKAFPDTRSTDNILDAIRSQPGKGDFDGGTLGVPKSWDSVLPPGFIASCRPMTQEWGNRSKETTESLMAASLALAADSKQNVLAPLIYAPDYICGVIVFGASHSVKMHLMGMILFRQLPKTAELNRSVIDRLIHMFRQASSSSPTTPLADAGPIPSPPSVPNPSTSRGDTFAAPSIMATRCAHVLTAFVALWDQRVQEYVARDISDTERLDRESRSPMHADCDTAVEGPPHEVSPTISSSRSGGPQRENHPIAAAIPLFPGDTAYSQPHSHVGDMAAPYHGVSSEIPAMEPFADFIASFPGYSLPGNIPDWQTDVFGLHLDPDIALSHGSLLGFDLPGAPQEQ